MVLRRVRCGSIIGGLVAATVLPAHGLTAQDVSGLVTDEAGRPLPAAVITLHDSDGEAVTRTISGEDGRYRLEVKREGEYRVAADNFGYVRLETPLAALGDRPVTIDFELPADPVELDELRVEVEQNEQLREAVEMFGVRPEMLGRRFVPRSEIEKREISRDFGQILQWQSIAGMQIIRPEDVGSVVPDVCVILSRHGCALTALDGGLVSREFAASIPPEILGGVVVLKPVEATLVFGTEGAPGAVLLFTRAYLTPR